jgi:hypothetical protein
MGYGDKIELNVDINMRITTNGGTDVVLSPAAEDGRLSTAAADGSGDAQPDITTIDLNGAGPMMPAANGPERYRVRIERVR